MIELMPVVVIPTDGAVLDPVAALVAKSGVDWSTPVKEAAPTEILPLTDRVATILFAPVDGATSLHTSLRIPVPASALTKVQEMEL
jgi:hypothetical protein